MFDTGWMESAPRPTITDLKQMVERVRPVSLASEQLLPLAPVLANMFGSGLRRGSTVLLKGGSGATSLALATCAAATANGLWLGCLNAQSLGWAAAHELGVDLNNVVTVTVPGRDLVAACGAMVDVFDMVLFDTARGVSVGEARKLAARARERGCVLLLTDDRRRSIRAGSTATGSSRGDSAGWPEPTDVVIDVAETSWAGLGSGHGRLREGHMQVDVTGRRGFSAARSTQIQLVGGAGHVAGEVDGVDQPERAERASRQVIALSSRKNFPGGDSVGTNPTTRRAG